MTKKEKIETLKTDINTLHNMQLLLQNAESEALSGTAYTDIQESITEAEKHLSKCLENLA